MDDILHHNTDFWLRTMAPMVIINWLGMFTTQESDFLKNFGQIPMPPVSLLCTIQKVEISVLTIRMEMRHLQASRTPVETGACILHGNWKRAEYLTRWSLMSILEENHQSVSQWL